MYCKQKFDKFNLTKNNFVEFYHEVDKKAFSFTEETPEASQPDGHSKHVVKFFVNRHEQTFVIYIFVNTRLVMLLLAGYGCLRAV